VATVVPICSSDRSWSCEITATSELPAHSLLSGALDAATTCRAFFASGFGLIYVRWRIRPLRIRLRNGANLDSFRWVWLD
jgi:hypothetical protein